MTAGNGGKEINMNAHSRVIQVIQTTYSKGIGTQEDPARRVTAYFDFDGKLICERDEFLESLDQEKRDKMIEEAIKKTFG